MTEEIKNALIDFLIGNKVYWFVIDDNHTFDTIKMPQFTPRADRAQAAFVILPKGNYLFRVGEPKPFFNPLKPGAPEGKVASWGVRYPLEVVSSPDNSSQVGKKIQLNLFLHTEGSEGVSKRFMMAARGFDPSRADAEEQFNSAIETEDQSVNTDTGMVGEYYLKVKGNLVGADLDVGPQRDDPTKEQQNFKRWIPQG